MLRLLVLSLLWSAHVSAQTPMNAVAADNDDDDSFYANYPSGLGSYTASEDDDDDDSFYANYPSGFGSYFANANADEDSFDANYPSGFGSAFGDADDANTNATGGWYIADHPYGDFIASHVRDANGSYIANANFSIPPWTYDEFQGHVTSGLPWYVRWYIDHNDATMKKYEKEGKRTVLYWFISPMDFGKSARSIRNRKFYQEAVAHFWFEFLGRPILEGMATAAKYLLVHGVHEMVNDKLLWNNYNTMDLETFAQSVNITGTDLEIIKQRAATRVHTINYTLPYEPQTPLDLSVHAMKVAGDVATTVAFYQPYAQYTQRYYNPDEEYDLKPPALPAAIQYPWPWHTHIAETRTVLLQMMRVATAALRHNVSTGDGQVTTQRMLRSAEDDTNTNNNTNTNKNNQTNASTEAAAMRLILQQIQEFHFTTGIPRFNGTHRGVRFPTLNEFMNGSIASGNGSVGTSTEPDAGDEDLEDDTGRVSVYNAARAFYSFASVQTDFVKQDEPTEVLATAPPTVGMMDADADGRPSPSTLVRFANCSTHSPCLARSGVTLYTPSLVDAVREVFVNASIARAQASMARTKRLNWLQHLSQEVFDAEIQTLRAGLVAPSTAWYSMSDRETDLVSDSLLALANATKSEMLVAGEKLQLARVLFATLYEGEKTPLLQRRHYYAMTNAATRSARDVKRTVPKLEPFTNEELGDAIFTLQQWIQQVNNATVEYVATRDRDPMHRAMVEATDGQVLYDGRMYGLLGFGYLLPATNELNVAFRDHKLPDPFHVVLRLLVRLQESRLLLPDESRLIMTCLAMQRFDMEYYRCSGIDTGVDTASMDRVTVRPMPAPDVPLV